MPGMPGMAPPGMAPPGMMVPGMMPPTMPMPGMMPGMVPGMPGMPPQMAGAQQGLVQGPDGMLYHTGAAMMQGAMNGIAAARDNLSAQQKAQILAAQAQAQQKAE